MQAQSLCFLVNFAKFLRTHFLQNTPVRLLLMPYDWKRGTIGHTQPKVVVSNVAFSWWLITPSYNLKPVFHSIKNFARAENLAGTWQWTCTVRQRLRHPEAVVHGFFKIGVLKNFEKLTGEPLCWSLLK